ncbi:hypothetical protein [Streptomyces clavuligerus]|uniref:Chitinase n=1 Tax=Streptomyces clavuligerus TaxID=1901 RepID=D5SLY5_STRCL|nr:hypothetical protein [Streptomyces clavuligerus]EFG04928.1 Hypothetical protein SCLAV_p1446 [Streptomyces clavuligerus]MBY6306635.1 hypothetical protein [Streptomyces clavuligerus]QCS10758.1 hypothetical protein CRV15_35150 [Streptomyces clavuligerus]QPJ97207.1 hypothetical protein GE265_29335 [Streptomyces clavuligerus]WDN57471.1 hypothetical protein LL058_37510 [Streptomyces clavuligerus]
MLKRLRSATLIASAICTSLLFGTTGTAQAADTPLITRFGSGDFLAATAWEHSNYGGAYLQFFSDINGCSPTTPSHKYDQLPQGWNDKISSMRIPGSLCGGYAFDHIKRYGPMTRVDGNIPAMPAGWNDRVSSLEVLYAWWWPTAT